MIVRSCRLPSQHAFAILRARHFSSTGILRGDPTNHYETLGLSINATQGEIKKQFYALSKSNHPDLHPNDPSAATRFMAVSEAYHILGDSALRSRYDRSLQPASTAHAGPHGPTTPRGSHSSHSAAGPAGSRPASGLSKRRTQFRGPPPSFYRSGGWGAQSAKRGEHAAKASRGETAGTEAGGAARGEGESSSYARAEPGTGPGGFSAGFDNDVPHFDHEGHFRTHESVERTRHRSRTWVPRTESDIDTTATEGGSVMGGFVAIMGVLGVVLGVSTLILTPTTKARTVDGLERRRRDS